MLRRPLIFSLICIALLPLKFTAGQGTAGESAKYEYRELIDLPTAGILEKGFIGINANMMPAGVMIAQLEVGIFKNLSFGISFGGANVIGNGNVDWYKLPAVLLRVRVLNETTLVPAITIGFNSQGKGIYHSEISRYDIKSPGFYAGVSKNFAMLGFLALHATANYSLENKDGDNFVNFGVGLEKTIGSRVSLIIEYDFALNDNNGDFGSGKGYLNAGLRWSIGSGFTIELDFRDLLKNQQSETTSNGRALRIEYIQGIF